MTNSALNWETLYQHAIHAMQYSYSPYSKYKVGAALLTTRGNIYQGCNIENVGFSASVCAERTAVFKAISSGEKEFVAIAIATVNGGAPCGICRQVLREFAPDITIIFGDTQGDYQVCTLKEMLPYSFGPENLPKAQ